MPRNLQYKPLFYGLIRNWYITFLLCQIVELKVIDNVTKGAEAACSSMSIPTLDMLWQGQVSPAFMILKSIKCNKSRSLLVPCNSHHHQVNIQTSFWNYITYQNQYSQSKAKKLSCYFPNFLLNQLINQSTGKHSLLLQNLYIYTKWDFLVTVQTKGDIIPLIMCIDLALRK